MFFADDLTVFLTCNYILTFSTSVFQNIVNSFQKQALLSCRSMATHSFQPGITLILVAPKSWYVIFAQATRAWFKFKFKNVNPPSCSLCDVPLTVAHICVFHLSKIQFHHILTLSLFLSLPTSFYLTYHASTSSSIKLVSSP